MKIGDVIDLHKNERLIDVPSILVIYDMKDYKLFTPNFKRVQFKKRVVNSEYYIKLSILTYKIDENKITFYRSTLDAVLVKV